MIKVDCKVESHDSPKKEDLIVQSHWNSPPFIVLKCGEHHTMTVLAKDLIAAINNCTNSARR